MVERVPGAIFENATAPTQAFVTRWGSDPCESSRYLYFLCRCTGSIPINVYSVRGSGGGSIKALLRLH